jgi:uncharacterized OB-fold protein
MTTSGHDVVHAPVLPALSVQRNPHTEPFWAAAREGRLAVPRCKECGTFSMPPKGFCPSCRSQEYEFVTLSGRAVLYTYSVVRHAVIPALSEYVPYVLAVVKLPDAADLKFVTNVVECDVDQIKIGQELEVVFHDQGEGVTVPRFRPVA